MPRRAAWGLEPQQYLLLLAVRGLPEGTKATIQGLAERLMLKHNSTVELIDRLETHGYVRRSQSREDRRCVLVKLLPRGKELRGTSSPRTAYRNCAREGKHCLMPWIRFWDANRSLKRVSKSGQSDRASHVNFERRGKNREQG